MDFHTVKLAFLISVGTAVCGGSAMAAVNSVVEANEVETAVSLTTIFVLNAVALITFPLIGEYAGLTQRQFGLRAAMGIHDPSSVVGAALKYGPVALRVATTVKLVRALWIAPLALVSAIRFRRRREGRWPWFIGFCLLGAWAHSHFELVSKASHFLVPLGRCGFSVCLFLIGAELLVEALRRAGWRPLAHGLVL